MKRQLFTFLIAIIAIPSRLIAEEVTIGVNGLVCGFCAQGIKKTFEALEGVAVREVDLDSKRVVIIVREGLALPDEQIKELITDAGYTVTTIERR